VRQLHAPKQSYQDVHSSGSSEKNGSKPHVVDLQLSHSPEVEFDSTYDEQS
jgi:hypothetical protein